MGKQGPANKARAWYSRYIGDGALRRVLSAFDIIALGPRRQLPRLWHPRQTWCCVARHSWRLRVSRKSADRACGGSVGARRLPSVSRPPRIGSPFQLRRQRRDFPVDKALHQVERGGAKETHAPRVREQQEPRSMRENFDQKYVGFLASRPQGLGGGNDRRQGPQQGGIQEFTAALAHASRLRAPTNER